MDVGRKIYYDNLTGNVLVDTGEMVGSVVEATNEQNYEAYTVLNERNKKTIGVVRLKYGKFAEDFRTCSGYRVDLATEKIIFSYPDPTAPEEVITPLVPLTEQIVTLEERIAALEAKLGGETV